MRLRLPSVLLALALTVPVSANDWSAGVSYSYDGSGNILRIGTDAQVYDTAGRLVQSDTNGIRSSFEYDSFGNRKRCLRPGSDCQPYTAINAANNRMVSATHDGAGNVTQFRGHVYTYDAVEMQRSDTAPSGMVREYIYTASDERIAIYTPADGGWRWTLRDGSGKVLRELASRNPTGGGTVGTASWSWIRDYVYRDSLLLASRQPGPNGAPPTTYHYHLDHLGTPRLITDDANNVVGRHSYHSFGPETSDGQNEPSRTPLKYTGHERDGDQDDQLDYMHARFYAHGMGRFLSVDPVRGDPQVPQSWNGYAYVRNSPARLVDPDGRKDKEPADHEKEPEEIPYTGTPEDRADRSNPINCAAFNCHSYVWHDGKDGAGDPTDPSNRRIAKYKPLWDNDPTDDVIEQGFVKLDSDEPNMIGDRILYGRDLNKNGRLDRREVTHSAFVVGVDSECYTTRAESKWGSGPIYIHHPRVVPASYGTMREYYRYAPRQK